jgi:hypothetical protein
MNLTCLIPFFVLVATNCHSAIAKEGQARRLQQEWERPMRRKAPSKGTNPSKGSKATNPSKGSKATNPSKGKGMNPSKGKGTNPSKGKAPTPSPTVTTSPTSCDDDPAFTFTAPKTKQKQDCAYITKNKKKLQQRQDNVCSVKENGVLVSSKCCAACTAAPTARPTAAPTSLCPPFQEPSQSDCDVTTFGDLEDAIKVCGDIKLPSATILFTKVIELSGKQLTFTCPNGGDCVLDGRKTNQIFYIRGCPSNISFDGITFQNGAAIVSPQTIVVHS